MNGSGGAIELTAEERMLVEQIDFNRSSERHDADYWMSVGVAAQQLMESLLKRKVIPEARRRYFTEPEFNIGGRGQSRAAVFEKNGTPRNGIFRHPHFLKYLHYFLYGPELGASIVEAFEQKIAECGHITSSDIGQLASLARQLTREYRLDAREAAEEFFKLALDCDLDLGTAKSIRDSVKKTR